MIQQRKIAKYVLLQIVTLGIYGLFFWSDWTEDLNKMCEDDDKESANYILVFLLDIFSLGIYSFVWNYTQAERMYRIAPQYGIELKHGGTYVLLLRTLLFFLPVIGSVERIKSFNALAVAYNASLDEEIVLETMKEQQEKKSKKEIKAEKKAQKKAQKEEKKNATAQTNEVTSVETNETVIDVTDNTDAIVEIPAPNATEEAKEYLTEENAPVYFEAPTFEKVDPVTYAPVVEEPVAEETSVEEPLVAIPTAEEIAQTLIESETVAEVDFSEPAFETVEAIDFSEPTFEVVDTDADFSESTFETVEAADFSENVYEIADVEIPNLDFADASAFETPEEIEEVAQIEFTEPAAYEISTEIADVTFIDDEDLVPTSKEDILKQATKTVGNKRTVKEKVAKEPTAKKSTKTTEEKKDTAAKTKKDASTKSTAKKETKPKTTKTSKDKAKKEVEKLVDEVKIDEVTFGDVVFEEVNLETDILNEIAEISKSKK